MGEDSAIPAQDDPADSRSDLRQHELLQLTVENVGEGIVLVDGDFRIIIFNAEFARLFGYEEHQVYEGADAAALMEITARRGELGPGDPKALVQALVAGMRSSATGGLRIHRNDGRILSIRRKTISGGRFIMVARDATDEHQAARLKNELVATVSHELRTPLTSILAALALVNSGKAGDLPPKVANLLTIAQRNCNRLTKLVNDLLDLERLDAQQLRLELSSIDLVELIHEVVQENAPSAVERNVGLSFARPSTPILVQGDSERLKQVLCNLLSNALKYSPANAVVTFDACVREDRALISVSDQGPGVDPGFRERLFTRFAQQDASSSKVAYGSGLGLAISKQIIEKHRGRIWLDEASGEGATFKFDLPLFEQPTGEHPAAGAAHQGTMSAAGEASNERA